MSTHVVGFRTPDEKWHQMKAIWKACKDANIVPPQEVLDFFDGEDPENKPGIEVSLPNAVAEWNDDHRRGYDVTIMALPEHVKIIRFYNSW